MLTWLGVAALGGVGAVARFALDSAVSQRAGSGFPWGTLAVNLSGAFLLGLLAGADVAGAALLGYFATRLQERLPPARYRRPFLATGFCGALTTFSTLQVELIRMLDAGHVALALGYALASLAAGFGAVALATGLTRRVRTVLP